MNSFNLSPIVFDATHKMNAEDVVKNFCHTYYQNMTTNGFGTNMVFFETDAKCNYNGTEYIGSHNVLVTMCGENISKILYDDIVCTPSIISDKNLMVYVYGLCRGVRFNGSLTEIFKFNEIFVLKLCIEKQNKIYISNHVFRLFEHK